MIYLDTSIVVPLVVLEEKSVAIRRWIGSVGDDALAISDWTTTELASALSLKVRSRHLTIAQAAEGRRVFAATAENLIVFTPTHADFARAADYLGNPASGLRAGDALHLGVAVNHGALPVYSLDRRLIAAGRKLRIRIESPL